MAIYHLSAKIISRGQGRAVSAAAAYRAGERLRDWRLGAWHDYTKKQGVGHRAILLPDGAPEAWADRETLWNAVELTERRRNAQLARELEIALPRELSTAEAIRLAEDFVRTEFVRRGMVADIAIHGGKPEAARRSPMPTQEGSFCPKAGTAFQPRHNPSPRFLPKPHSMPPASRRIPLIYWSGSLAFGVSWVCRFIRFGEMPIALASWP